ncbi:MAG: TolC family outer membrane protein [Alphaproteobacteria bacterium]
MLFIYSFKFALFLFFSLAALPLISNFCEAAEAPQKKAATVPGKETPLKGEHATVETLDQAFADAYLSNPDLDAARAQLHQRDEKVSQAVAEWRPDIVGSLSQAYDKSKADGTLPGTNTWASNRQKAIGVTVNQSLFSGGSTHFRTKSAEAGVLAGRETLLSSEQTVLLDTVKAFTDVYTKTQILGFLQASEKVLQSTVDQTRARYEVGEVTRTEVAAAEANFAEAVSNRVSSEGDLETARATFLKVIGRPPGKLIFPTVNLQLPKNRQQAIEMALKKNPSLQASKFQEEASRYDTNAQIGALLPQVSAEASTSRSLRDGAGVTSGGGKDMSVRLSVSLPIYRQGLTHSRVREAEQRVAETKASRQSTQRSVIQAMTQAWTSWIAAQKSREQLTLQVDASDLALRGVREEYTMGLKSLLDVLQIEEKWRDAQIALVRARQTETLAQFQILVLVGELTARNLKLKVPYHDPNVYYNEHRGDPFSLK